MRDLAPEVEKFQKLVSAAERILIISHISPDPDATCSVLLLGTTLKENYPDKSIRMSAEELPEGLDFLSSYEEITIEPLEKAIAEFKPDLIIMVDAMNFGRSTRGNWQAISSKIASSDTKMVIIDHHQPAGVQKNDLYINNGNPATAQEVYELLFNELKLKKPEGYAETAMVGIYSDTGGFVYLTGAYQQTLDLVAKLIGAGVSLESLKTRLSQYSEDQIKAIGQLATNLTHEANYSYSFLDDEFVNDWLNNGKKIDELHRGREAFLNNFIRNIDGRVWGFAISKDPRLGDDYYGVSLRSIAGTVDVSAIAAKLDGGGHKPAAGGKVQAASVDEAIEKVKKAIKG
jgi:phosphoesterase RecJ-like protein